MSTKVVIEDKELQISENEQIVFSWVSYDLLQLGIRSSSFSNIFKVPDSQPNRDALGVPEIITSRNDTPYRSLSANIQVDDIEFVNGDSTIEGYDGQNYSLSIKSGEGGFFRQIKSLSLNDIATELRTLNHAHTTLGVEALRDSGEGIVYPNIDYGYFERVADGDQPLSQGQNNFFYPSLYVKFIINSAIEKLGYNTIGDFWDSSIYSGLAIPAKRIGSRSSNVLANYTFIDETIAFGQLESEVDNVTVGRLSTQLAPLNFPEEISDEDEVYNDVNLGLGYTTFGYEFPAAFTESTQFEIDFEANFLTNLQPNFFISRFVNDAGFDIELVLYKKSTENREGVVYKRNFPIFRGTYDEIGFRQQLFYRQVYDINMSNSNPNLLSGIAADADDYVMVWEIKAYAQVDETYDSGDPINPLPPVVEMLEGFNFADIFFEISQADNVGVPNELDVPSSFEDINLGDLFLYVNNVTGTYPIVDEGNRTIRLESIDNVKRNKTKAKDWSGMLDLTNKPQVIFDLQGFAQANYFEYTNDSKDPFLEIPENYGRGVINVSDNTLAVASVKYKAPYSLVALRPTFNNTRTMGRIFTGEKYAFQGGQIFELIPDAKVETFANRITLLTRSTDNLIQISGGSGVDGNYEVANNPILFSTVLSNRYSIFNDIVDFPKVVKAQFRLTDIEAKDQDNKVVWIDYFNSYFYVNEVEEFNLTKSQSTTVTLIKI